MPAISYADFSGGLDRRLPINVQEASRLWELRNAYITQGKRIKKRPGIRSITSGLSGSVGLETINGTLTVFFQRGSGYIPPSSVVAIALDNPVGVAPGDLLDVKQSVIFQGFPYVVATHASSHITLGGVTTILPQSQHHYVDANPTTPVTDTNCPQTESITVAASRINAIGGEVIRYCAAGAARDWTTASDAGFLPASLQQNTKANVTAVGTFQDSLVGFFAESAQIWSVAVDPSANTLTKRIWGVGCVKPYAMGSWANDLAFLSQYGFRSMTVAETSDRIDDTDVGVQVDSLVIPDLATSNALPEGTRYEPFGQWIPQLGQFWVIFDNGTTSKAWVFTYSKSSKIACWSEYDFPVRFRGMATSAGKLYLRTDSTLYEVSDTQYTDDGAAISVEVQMAFQDAKSPGVLKQIYGADYVFAGSPSVSFKYDPSDLTKETISQMLTGDTRPGDTVPVEICTAALAPVFRHSAAEAFEVSAATLYYNLLGING